MSAELQRTNRNQADRAKQGIVVFSRVAQRDLFASPLIERTDTGWRLQIRNPWYTGTYLSTVSFIQISVNGHVVPEADTFIALRGQRIPAAYAKNLHEIWWGMGEVAELFLTDPALADILTATNQVGVDIDMRTTFSYGFPNDTLPYRLTGELEMR
ncbi:C-glycoside deglycosidase beta subunit domain-containing protein [Niveispirillum sp. KHB5.9]|uniref:C-glycoside deglycosidase beta subunit domain-containing protein n=1 Tax=Niveispirillum sp. KHB5.9 TaxID=3400269 RepID=UPI003A89624F